MNTEQIFEGPGNAAMGTYILEIALILLGAFILGYLLRLMLNSKLKLKVESLESELSILRSRTAPKDVDLSVYNNKISVQASEIERLSNDLYECTSAKIKAENSFNALSESVAEDARKAEEEYANLAAAVVDIAENNSQDSDKFGTTIEETARVDVSKDVSIKNVDEEDISIISNSADASKVSMAEELESRVLGNEVSSSIEIGGDLDNDGFTEAESKGEEIIEDNSIESVSGELETGNSEEVLSTLKDEKGDAGIGDSGNEEESSIDALKKIILGSSKSTKAVSNAPDDLKKIEGIGPKIEQLLNADGIYSFSDLVESEVARVKNVLIAAGPNYAVHDPATWAEQAVLARDGKWDVLKTLQDNLKGGKRRKK